MMQEVPSFTGLRNRQARGAGQPVMRTQIKPLLLLPRESPFDQVSELKHKRPDWMMLGECKSSPRILVVFEHDRILLVVTPLWL
jgi:hypothetical protein